MKQLIKQSLSEIYLEDFVRNIQVMASSLPRKLRGIDQVIINDYFDRHPIRKLNIGCGNNILKGWLNSDYSPISSGILQLDATKVYPFKAGEFDYIFSEHMIEHVPYHKGRQMLSECFRILKSEGKLRIATPDLSFLIDLYRSNKSELQIKFIKYSIDKYIAYAPDYQDTFVINNYVRAWGHQFIYDEKVLSRLMADVGFVKITRFNVGESRDKALQNLENVSRKPAGLLALESLVLEGTKP